MPVLTVTMQVSCGRHAGGYDVIGTTTSGDVRQPGCPPAIIVDINAVPAHRSALQCRQYPAGAVRRARRVDVL